MRVRGGSPKSKGGGVLHDPRPFPGEVTTAGREPGPVRTLRSPRASREGKYGAAGPGCPAPSE